jgi:hypothetical protein
MYVDISHVRQGDKTYTRYLLRESFRDHGKVSRRRAEEALVELYVRVVNHAREEAA